MLYCFVPRSGEIVNHLAGESWVNVAYANPENDSYVSGGGGVTD